MSQKRYTPQQRFQKVEEVFEKIKDTRCSLAIACAEAGISRSTYSRWRNKLLVNGEYLAHEVIPEKSRRPKHLARKISPSTRQRVVEEAGKPNHMSANQIAQYLQGNGLSISTAKVIEILKEEGLYGVIHITNAKGVSICKSGLLRLCEKHHSGAQRSGK